MKAILKAAFLSSLSAAVLALALPAMAEVVVVVNPKAAESSMSKDQVAQFFLGKSSSMTPVDQPESAAIRAEFYKKVTDKDASQVKSLWSKLVFTGKATMPKEAGDSAAVKKAVAADPKGIGYIEKSAVDASVKVIYTAQ
jgi:ABC-type phosphate transport system substrate-binding protein